MKKHNMLLCTAILGSFSFICLSQKADADTIDMYRLYNPNTGEHLYTASANERDNLIPLGWRNEGIGWASPDQGDIVYRLYNPNAGEHLYTLSLIEYNQLRDFGWKQEGQAFYSATTEDIPVHRLYNPNQFAFNHHYTKSKKESDWLDNLGWNYEGIAWYGVEDETSPILPETYNVTIQYLDMAGKELKVADVVSVKAGDDYFSTAPTISGYTLDGPSTQYLTHITQDMTVTFTYSKNSTSPTPPPIEKVDITINYIDANDPERNVQAASTISVSKGSDYTAESQTIEDYTLYGETTQVLQDVTTDISVSFYYVSNTTPFTFTTAEETATITGFKPGEEMSDVVIPTYVVQDQKVYKVTEIGQMAFMNSNLTSVEIPASVTEIQGYAFGVNMNLEVVTFAPDSTLKTIGSSAFMATKLPSVEIPASVIEIQSFAFGSSGARRKVTFAPDSKLTTIGEQAFGFGGLTSIEIPASVTEIQNDAFAGNTTLNTVTFMPDSRLKTVGSGAFMENASLTSIEIPNSVTAIDAAAFYNCTALASIEIPNSVTTIGEMAFHSCTALASIEIPNSVTVIGDAAFYNCTSLKNASIPSTAPTDYSRFLPANINVEDGTLIVRPIPS